MVRMALFMAPTILLSQLWGISGALREPSPSPAAPHCPLVAFLGIAAITALPLMEVAGYFPPFRTHPVRCLWGPCWESALEVSCFRAPPVSLSLLCRAAANIAMQIFIRTPELFVNLVHLDESCVLS